MAVAGETARLPARTDIEWLSWARRNRDCVVVEVGARRRPNRAAPKRTLRGVAAGDRVEHVRPRWPVPDSVTARSSFTGPC